MKPIYYGLLFAILSPFFSSIATVFQSGATKLLTPLIVASIGGLLGGIALLSLVLLSKEKFNIKKIRKNLKDLTFMTFFRPVLGVTIFAYGLSMTGAIKAIFFTKMEPYFVLGLFWLLGREKIKIKHLILLTIHIIGAIVLSTGANFAAFGRAQFGDLLIISAMGLFALSYFYGTRLSRNLGAKISNSITLGIGGLILLPFALIFSPLNFFVSQPLGWTYLISYVILFNLIGLTLWFASLKTVKGWMVSALRSIGPLVGAPFAYFLFGETLSFIQIVGGVVVLITSALIAREHLIANSRPS